MDEELLLFESRGFWELLEKLDFSKQAQMNRPGFAGDSII